jgi:NADH-quinone oxidoreductase subunit L
VVKPLMVLSTYFLGWVVDKALLGGTAWLLGGIATFSGALLQRWQSGNIRSYAAWLAAGAAAVLIFILVLRPDLWPQGPVTMYGVSMESIRKLMGH